ncbi:MAG TPA: hypothetical protein VMV92_14445 [Streptosporangiaceae bacterium]|nr:hypothetical protein [Streptosporangiaceae bacterium]
MVRSASARMFHVVQVDRACSFTATACRAAASTSKGISALRWRPGRVAGTAAMTRPAAPGPNRAVMAARQSARICPRERAVPLASRVSS